MQDFDLLNLAEARHYLVMTDGVIDLVIDRMAIDHEQVSVVPVLDETPLPDHQVEVVGKRGEPDDPLEYVL